MTVLARVLVSVVVSCLRLPVRLHAGLFLLGKLPRVGRWLQQSGRRDGCLSIIEVAVSWLQKYSLFRRRSINKQSHIQALYREMFAFSLSSRTARAAEYSSSQWTMVWL